MEPIVQPKAELPGDNLQDEAGHEETAFSLKKPPHRKLIIIVSAIVAVLAIGIVVAWRLYEHALTPVQSGRAVTVYVEVPAGTSPQEIASSLENKGVIRSARAFLLYARLNGLEQQLQAGNYRLSPSDSTSKIIGYLAEGRVDNFWATFFPGASLMVDASPNDATPSHYQVLRSLGYSDGAIRRAFAKTYSHPLFKDKPADASLEGYIFGETYRIPAGATVEDILSRSFDQMYEVIEREGLVARFNRQGLNLYQAITLASIIEREVGDPADQRQVAQVFLARLQKHMPLGADATFVYAAALNNEAPRPDYPSAYNTRLHTGLPPGPIASPGASALKAVADPASGDYLYFLSGDDGRTYFARTLEEHEKNIGRYCQRNCNLL